MAYLTTVIIPDYVAPQPEVVGKINGWCAWQVEHGQYTGELEYGFLPDGTTWQIKRWDWVNTDVCDAYFDVMHQNFTHPNVITEISEH